MSTELVEAQRRFFATLEIARRELVVLNYSHGKLFSNRIERAWVEKLATDMDAAETLESFISRYGRFQDTVGGKLIPRALAALAENPGSALDNFNRAERLELLESVEDWLTARELRNRLVHEYMIDPEKFAQDIRAAGKFVPMLRRVYQNYLHIAEDKFHVSETDLKNFVITYGPSARS